MKALVIKSLREVIDYGTHNTVLLATTETGEDWVIGVTLHARHDLEEVLSRKLFPGTTEE